MCGIFGQISVKAKAFNKRAFCTMGVRNDSRGGDSCGIFIDGNVEYGIDKQKLFINFFRDSKLLEYTTTCKIALGHCRKASVGKVGLETAQPVVIYNDQNKIEFVVIHNGTIYNYEELAKKYLDLFRKKNDVAKQLVQKWIPIVAASQSVKNKPEEKELLTKWIDVVEYE